MAILLSPIRAPRWSRPALLLSERAFRVVVERPLTGAASLALTRDCTIYPLAASAGIEVAAGLFAHDCLVPEGASPQLYDLEIRDGEARYTSPNAVALCAPFAGSCTFLHTSDLHLLLPGVSGPQADQSARLEALVTRINALKPDFVIHTGDLISRYGADKEPLSTEMIAWQARRAQEILMALRVPLLLTVGNHDVAFASSREAWRAYMGSPWERATDDYAFDYGPFHFTALDCFAHYEGQTAVAQSFTEEQLAWLEDDLRRASASRWRLLFIHYDYHQQLMPLLGRLPVDMLFYGHSNKHYHGELQQHGIRDGHLPSSAAHRLVHVTPTEITSLVMPWIELIKETA